MIDMESAVFTALAAKVREKFPSATVSGEYVNAPAKFPFVSIVEADNSIDSRYFDGGGEKFAKLLYEVNVYSNRAGTKKAECRQLLRLIDEEMVGMNFTRLSMSPVPNLEDGSIYRLNARYEGVADGTKIYRR